MRIVKLLEGFMLKAGSLFEYVKASAGSRAAELSEPGCLNELEPLV